MKSLMQRLWWAVFGYRTEPWPVLPPPPQVLTQAELESVFGQNQAPGGVLSPHQHDHLRGSIKLAADLLAPHFQSAISAESLGLLSGTADPARRFLSAGMADGFGFEQYLAVTTNNEEIDLLLSGAAWLAKASDLDEGAADRLWSVARNDIYRPGR